MKIDCAQSIQFIMNNFDKLNLNKGNLRELQNVLNLLKMQVEQQIVQEAILGNPDLKQQIEDAKKTLAARLEVLREKNDKEQEKLEGVPLSYQHRVKEIPNTEDMIKKLEQLLPTLDKPEQFIQQFLTQESEEKTKDKYQSLISSCATNMAYGYMNMESSRIEDNLSLFSHDANSDNFHGYSPNPQAISAFLDLIRDPELVSELSSYEKSFKALRSAESHAENANEAYSNANSLKEVIVENPETCKEVETYVEQLFSLISEKDSILEQKRQNTLLIIQPNIFSRLISRISGKSKKLNIKNEELSNQANDIEKQIKELFELKNPARCRNDATYDKVYKAYLKAANIRSPLKKDKDVSWGYNNTEIAKDEFDRLAVLSKVATSQEDSMHEFVLKATESYIQPFAQEQSNAAALLKQEKEKNEVSHKYDKLSPKAKELIDKSPDGFIPMQRD